MECRIIFEFKDDKQFNATLSLKAERKEAFIEFDEVLENDYTKWIFSFFQVMLDETDPTRIILTGTYNPGCIIFENEGELNNYFQYFEANDKNHSNFTTKCIIFNSFENPTDLLEKQEYTVYIDINAFDHFIETQLIVWPNLNMAEIGILKEDDFPWDQFFSSIFQISVDPNDPLQLTLKGNGTTGSFVFSNMQEVTTVTSLFNNFLQFSSISSKHISYRISFKSQKYIGNDSIIASQRLEKDNFIFTEYINKNLKINPNANTKIPKELSSLYQRLSYSYSNNDQNELLQSVTDLYTYAFDHPTDFDVTLSDIPIPAILNSCLSQRMPLPLRESTLSFFTNTFKQSDTLLLKHMINEGIIPILRSIIYERNNELTYIALECLGNITRDSIDSRDNVLNVLRNEDFYYFIIETNNIKIQKSASKLLYSCCIFNVDENLFLRLLQILQNCLLQGPRNIYHILLESICSLINSKDTTKMFLNESNSQGNIPLLFFSSFIMDDDPKIAISSISFVITLNLNNDKAVPINYEQVISLFNNTNNSIVFYALRLIANAIVLNDELCELIVQSQNIKIICNIILEGTGKNVIEALLLLSNLVRKTNKMQYYLLMRNYNLVTMFVDGLSLEDPFLVLSLLSTLDKMLSNDLENGQIRKQFDDANGAEIIQMLMESENDDVAQRAMIFERTFVENNNHYQF